MISVSTGIETQTNRQTDGHSEGKTERQKDRQTGRQTYRPTEHLTLDRQNHIQFYGWPLNQIYSWICHLDWSYGESQKGWIEGDPACPCRIRKGTHGVPLHDECWSMKPHPSLDGCLRVHLQCDIAVHSCMIQRRDYRMTTNIWKDKVSLGFDCNN